MGKEDKKGMRWWFWIILLVAVLFIAYMSWDDGFNDGFGKGEEFGFNQGINWSIGWTHDNCLNYMCGLNNIDCSDNFVKTTTEIQCYDIIGGEGK